MSTAKNLCETTSYGATQRDRERESESLHVRMNPRSLLGKRPLSAMAVAKGIVLIAEVLCERDGSVFSLR